MALIAAGWIAVLLLLGGVALDRTLTNLVTRNFDEQLEYMLTAMIASAEIGPDGEVFFYRTLGDQRFLEPNSGLYWQITGEGFEPWASPELRPVGEVRARTTRPTAAEAAPFATTSLGARLGLQAARITLQ